MAHTKLTAKGVVTEKAGSDAFEVKVPVTFDANIQLTTDVLTVNSGTFTVSDGQSVLTRTSGSGTSGFLKLGRVPNLADADQVLLVISGATGEGGRNGILLFGSGATAGAGQLGSVGSANGGGGVIGVFQAPPANSIYLYSDGTNLFFRNSSGYAKVLATGSTGIPI